MDGNNGMKVKRNDEAVWRVIDGEVVVLLPEERALHALTGCGSRVWELIEEETAISEIVQKICAEYDVEPQRAREEITEYVNKLEAMKLVDIVPVAGEEAIR
jgi:Cdc6-like AAA superfamily ATPase